MIIKEYRYGKKDFFCFVEFITRDTMGRAREGKVDYTGSSQRKISRPVSSNSPFSRSIQLQSPIYLVTWHCRVRVDEVPVHAEDRHHPAIN